MRGELSRTEHGREGAVADIEPPGEGTEGRHHQAFAVRGEAAAADRAAALHDTGNRMQVARELALRRIARRLVAKRERAKAECRRERAADPVGGVGIMISGDPHPFAPALESVTAAGFPGANWNTPSETKPFSSFGSLRSSTAAVFEPSAHSINTGALLARFSWAP